MAKSKRNPRAKNKIASSVGGDLIKVDPTPVADTAVTVYRSQAIRIARPTLFSAEFEKVIEIIARERVYRAMLDRLGRRLLTAPVQSGEDRVA
jgi:hypothetical protein